MSSYSCKGTKCLTVLMNEATLARTLHDSVEEQLLLQGYEQCWWLQLLLQGYEVFVSVDEWSYSCKGKVFVVLMNAATLARVWSVCQCWWMLLLLQGYEVFDSVDECSYSCKGTKCLSVLMNAATLARIWSVCQCWWMQLLLQGIWSVCQCWWMQLLLQGYEVFVSVDDCSYSCKGMKCLTVLMNEATLARVRSVWQCWWLKLLLQGKCLTVLMNAATLARVKCLSVLMTAATLARIWSVCQCWWMQLLLQEYEVFDSVDECCYSCKGMKCLTVLMNAATLARIWSVCQCWWMQLLLQECLLHSLNTVEHFIVLMNAATLARIHILARVAAFIYTVKQYPWSVCSVDEHCSYLARVAEVINTAKHFVLLQE